MPSLGIQLEQLCAAGRREVLLVAPFVKANSLHRLLQQIRADLPVRCVTRWRPEEIIAGVSDLEVWPLLRDRPQSSLWLRDDLHAKYYRADASCLVGSANLTDTALGWSRQPNLELLIALPADRPELQAFEGELQNTTTLVDETLYQQTLAVVELLQSQTEPIPIVIHERADVEYAVEAGAPGLSSALWLPTLRQPADLYLAYQGRSDELTGGARIAAATDLRAFVLPAQLSKPAFNAYLGLLLLQKPLVREIDTLLAASQRFGAIRDRLAGHRSGIDADFDASRAWQTLMRWLLYFLPDRYERVPARHSEVLRRTH